MNRKRLYQVYKHTNTVNGKVYIGITSWTWQKRWYNRYKKNNYFHSSIVKYGDSAFTHEVLYKDLTLEEAKEKEIELINKYNSSNPYYGYNHSSGGDAHYGCRHTKETKLKISLANKGRILSIETRNKISVSNKGKHTSPVWLDRIAQSKRMKGNNYNSNRKIKRGGSKKRTPVAQYDKQSNLIAVFNSIKDAAKNTGCYKNRIHECLIGKRKSTKGFIWKHIQNT